MINFKYLSFPQIPIDLLDDKEYILTGKDAFFERKAYKAVVMNKRLHTFCIEEILLPFFKSFEIVPFIDYTYEKLFTYHVINKLMGPHIDIGRIITINYILESGNEANLPYTTFYDNLTNKTETERIQIETNKWHFLRVSVPHSVIGIADYRIAITCNMNGPETIHVYNEIK